MATEAQRRARLKYEQGKVQSVLVKFYPKDSDLYDYIESKGNKSGYIKSLIRADMESAEGRVVDVGEDLGEEAPWE